MNEKKSHKPIWIFLIFLLALLVLPVSFPLLKDRLDSASHENRTLSAFPVLTGIGELSSYTAALENYLNDHLPYKNQLVAVNANARTALRLDQTMVHYLVGGQVIIGKENWLFYNGTEPESTLDDYLCNNLYTEQELREIAEGYTALNEKYRSEGIEFVLFIPPNKEQVYPEFMPDSLVPLGQVSRTDQLTEYLSEHTDVPVIYAKEELTREKEEGYQVFYKYDTHWNKLGAFVGVQLINEALQGEKSSLSEVTVEAVDGEVPNDLAGVLGLAGSLVEPKDLVIKDYQPGVSVQITSDNKQPLGEFISYASNAADSRKLVMIKDSFSINMMEYLPYDYAETAFVTDSAQAKQYIEENHPDIVILEVVERQHFRAELQWRELL